MPTQDRLIVRGAREHNLKNIDIDIPRDKLVVFTGLSGSGKSSLAFDTIFAEGQRRYVESLSAYARQFLGQMDKPDLDLIEGLSPAISIDQKGSSRNPRSTVGTVTEIYDYMRLMFARIGHPHCPKCGRPIERQSVQQMAGQILAFADGTRLMLLAPVIRDRKGEHAGVFDEIRRQGFVRVRVDGEILNIDDPIKLAKTKKHSIEVVVDRLVIHHEDNAETGEDNPERIRIIESLETCLRIGDGLAIASIVDGEDILFSESYACPYDGFSFGEIEPRSFSFNSPHGACPTCTGLGTQLEFEPDLIIPNHNLTINEGAIRPWHSMGQERNRWFSGVLEAASERYGFPLDVPVREMSAEAVRQILYGTADKLTVRYVSSSGKTRTYTVGFEGVVPNLKRRYESSSSDYVREELERYMATRPCPTCHGARLKPEVLAVTVGGRSIIELTQVPVHEMQAVFAELAEGRSLSRDGITPPAGIAAPRIDDADLKLSNREMLISKQIIKEIRERVGFLVDVGLNYLSLDRAANTLSGGEAQRIRLATQIGSSLMGVLYILDEPSIGLHQRDNAKLIRTLERLRDIGNTLIVVEHDEDTMRAADWILDIGPGAGEHGGHVVGSGTYDDIARNPDSLTGQFLSGRRQIHIPEKRRRGNGHALTVRGASGNNLRNVTVDFPLGTFTCVTGVSGSGKSTLVTDTLYRRLAQELHGAKSLPDKHQGIDGIEYVDKIIDIDQSPIGRTPRSNPATYTGVFTPIRELFASMPEAKARGYQAGRFSFNVKGGRCEACKGEGVIQIEMNFLPDVYVPCEVCHGRRYNREALEILYKGKSIADVLDMTVTEAVAFFENVPAVANKMKTLEDVGLGYIRLGQPATQLSGGEAQRVKLSSELSRRATGKTVYILDEPTTGLHFADIERLLGVLQRLADGGNTVIVIEHNLDVIKSADWLIDLGPEGGDGGGQIIVEGTPETVADTPASFTGQYLRPVLGVEQMAAD